MQNQEQEKIGQRIALLQRHVGGESFRRLGTFPFFVDNPVVFVFICP